MAIYSQLVSDNRDLQYQRCWPLLITKSHFYCPNIKLTIYITSHFHWCYLLSWQPDMFHQDRCPSQYSVQVYINALRGITEVDFFLNNTSNALTILRTCCEKFWLINLASIARLRGALMLLPSSWGGSVAVSLTDNMSTSQTRLWMNTNSLWVNTNTAMSEHKLSYEWIQMQLRVNTNMSMNEHKHSYKWTQTRLRVNTNTATSEHKHGYEWTQTRLRVNTNTATSEHKHDY